MNTAVKLHFKNDRISLSSNKEGPVVAPMELDPFLYL